MTMLSNILGKDLPFVQIYSFQETLPYFMKLRARALSFQRDYDEIYEFES